MLHLHHFPYHVLLPIEPNQVRPATIPEKVFDQNDLALLWVLADSGRSVIAEKGQREYVQLLMLMCDVIERYMVVRVMKMILVKWVDDQN